MGAVRAGCATGEAAREQAEAGTRWGSRHWRPESSLIGRGPESLGGKGRGGGSGSRLVQHHQRGPRR